MLEILPPVTSVPEVEVPPESQGIPGVDIPVAPTPPDSSADLEVIPPVTTEPEPGTVIVPPSVPTVDSDLATAG